MLRARFFEGAKPGRLVIAELAIVTALLSVGCDGGGTTTDAVTILMEFQGDSSAATKKYAGKTVRLQVEKVISSGKAGKELEFVTIQGQVGYVVVDATVKDPAEMEKALAIKLGEPAIFEGEPVAGMGEVRGMGALFLKSAKVMPK
ncbi:hypothetical protein LOC68_01490 [Blastopirellula sp. JC732]|uniref:Uncharacterized protein n=1 Tax=Blastopirellula sediminis TaxID=2894196 RepID=A0A9X1MHA8_9BACT|nr:hypothetical protein [Blastopirellula sediminis]MCC9608139.1 hypothetical protein [Blastopirellula sediminis]MCC9627068.1 hypothetical protein [Blastopirellula sediminis]